MSVGTALIVGCNPADPTSTSAARTDKGKAIPCYYVPGDSECFYYSDDPNHEEEVTTRILIIANTPPGHPASKPLTGRRVEPPQERPAPGDPTRHPVRPKEATLDPAGPRKAVDATPP